MRETLLTLYRSRDLRYSILFTIGILVLIRVIAHIPLPQIDRSQLANFLNQSQNQIFGVLSLFTGGSLARLSLDVMGVGPYITASIIVQLLTKAIPKWEEISKEGTSGREKLNQYTRYLTVPLAFIQGYATITLLKSQGILPLLSNTDLVQILLTITATSIFVMWLGELITERGIGNGISMIIALGIIGGLPQLITNTASVLQAGSYFNLAMVLGMLILMIAVIILVNEAERKIPITYARRSVASPGAVDSYLPLRVNIAGVIPIIFALSFLTFPAIIARFLSTAKSENVVQFANWITNTLSNQTYYGIFYFLLVFIFTFFYTYIIFQPTQIAENLQQQGSFIPGVRPGSETSRFLSYTIGRITVMGAIFLAAIAIMPILLERVVNIPSLVISGTSVLIVVSVVIETSRKLSSQIIMHRYDS